MRRGIGTATASLVAAVTLALPGAAQADYFVDVTSDGTMTVTGGVILGITYTGSQYRINDASANASPDAPCFPDGTFFDTAYCPASQVARIDASATLQVQEDDGGGPNIVPVPSKITVSGLQAQAYGGSADDVITSTFFEDGHGSGDQFFGNGGDDTLRGGFSYANFSPDQLIGGEGDDILDGGPGPDVLNGGNGVDRVEYPGRSDALKVTLPQSGSSFGNGGSADLTGSRDQISEVENVTGGSGPDSLTGNSFQNALDGSGGNDILDGGTGPDLLTGGAGTDTIDYSDRSEAIHASLPVGGFNSSGNGGAADGPVPRDRIGSAENLTGGSGPNTLTGNSLANLLLGGIGADVLTGGGGDDRITGGEGPDALRGQGGIDKLFARDGQRDKSLSCGPGKNRRERAQRDRRDPPAKSC